MSFIGALNVGSIVLNFDEVLKSNVKHPAEPYINDKNYQLLFNQTEQSDIYGIP